MKRLLALGFAAAIALPIHAQTEQPAPAAAPPAASASPVQVVRPNEPPPTPEEVADALTAHQRYQAAIAEYAKIAKPSAMVWNKMGIAYQMMFNTANAIRCYKQSIKMDAKNASVLNNLATVYDSMKEFGQAEKMYRKAMKINPKNAIIYKNLGTNLMAQKKYKKGMEAYSQALAIDPTIFQDNGSPRVSSTSSLQDRGALNYYTALGCVRAAQTDCAIKALRASLNQGYITAKKLAADPAFQSLRDNPEFQQLLVSQQELPKK